MPFVVIGIIIIICGLISITLDKLDDWWFVTGPRLAAFFGAYGFLLAAGVCLALLGVVILYFKPHPAEKHFVAYKKNEISRQQAIERIVGTLYNWRSGGVPPAWKSKIMEKRIHWLNRRVKAEEEFINNLISYMRTKNRWQR